MRDRNFHFIHFLFLFCFAGMLASGLRAQMDPYFTAINYPVKAGSGMLMLLPDFQAARFGPDFATTMGMAEFGLTPNWSAGIMAESEKISGLPLTYGGLRFNTYYRLFHHNHGLNLTLYGEYEDLNQAALYKMEVSGFGPEDLTTPLALARRTPARTFEQRVIVYYDWKHWNATFNFISETPLEAPYGDNFGYVWGVFHSAAMMEADPAGMGMKAMGRKSDPPEFSLRRLGYGLEMMGALGNNRQPGFYWSNEQQYLGPVFTYQLTRHWSLHLEPTLGLSGVSDPLVLRLGIQYMANHLGRDFGRLW